MIQKDWKVYQLNIDTGETKEVKGLASTYELEVVTCNSLNKTAFIYRAVYYIERKLK
jgi:hypothetical protein